MSCCCFCFSSSSSSSSSSFYYAIDVILLGRLVSSSRLNWVKTLDAPIDKYLLLFMLMNRPNASLYDLFVVGFPCFHIWFTLDIIARKNSVAWFSFSSPESDYIGFSLFFISLLIVLIGNHCFVFHIACDFEMETYIFRESKQHCLKIFEKIQYEEKNELLWN